MRLGVFEKNLHEQISSRIRDVTPGLCVRAYQGGRLVVDLSIGDCFAYYDLASLTKIIFTVQGMMVAFEKGRWKFETRVSEILSWWPHPETRVTELLTHSAGLEWWLPLYKDLGQDKSPAERREQLRGILAAQVPQKTETSVYSDIDFLLLGFLLEEFFRKPLQEIWQDLKNEFYLGTTFEFHPNNQPVHRTNLYAPTEECPWRRRLLQGEVDDENAWALGGVSTHAGLFGSIDDLGWYALLLRSQLLGIGRSSIKLKTMKLFAQRARPVGSGDWALGYMLPTPGTASCGIHFGLESIGHTGFTGTSLWFDPKQDLAVAILSNRVLYGRENKSFQQLRPQIHNWIVEGLKKAAY